VSPSAAVAAIMADPAFSRLKAHVVESTGLAYFVPRDADLAARLLRRMLATECADCGRYLSLLLHPEGAEREALVRELTIGETHFFRYQEQFEALRDHVFPAILHRNRHERRLRIWSAGCATGPEPYSLAILLEREFGAALANWHVSILATDLNQEFLQRAQAGVFAEWALRGLSEELRRDCFRHTDAGWRIEDAYRRWTTFQYHNLVTDPAPKSPMDGAAFDLVLCRNVMIYFNEETIRTVLSSLHGALQPDGWLLVGHAEGNQEWFRSFHARALPGTAVYQRKATGHQSGAALSGTPARRTPVDAPVEASRSPDPFGPMLAWRPHPLDGAPVTDPAPDPPAPQPVPDGVGEVRGHANRGAWQDAEESSRRLLADEPLNAKAHFYRGLTLLHQGDAVAAEAALRRAIFLESDLALAYYHLGLLLVGRGDTNGASRAFRNTLRALAGTPDDALLDGNDLTAARLREAVESQVRSLAA